MAAYYSKVSSLRPDFPALYKRWVESEKGLYKFSPIELNERYSKYRKVCASREIVVDRLRKIRKRERMHRL